MQTDPDCEDTDIAYSLRGLKSPEEKFYFSLVPTLWKPEHAQHPVASKPS